MKPKSMKNYECPHDKGLKSSENGKYYISGRHCKNNCAKYHDNSCKKWGKKIVKKTVVKEKL